MVDQTNVKISKLKGMTAINAFGGWTHHRWWCVSFGFRTCVREIYVQRNISILRPVEPVSIPQKIIIRRLYVSRRVLLLFDFFMFFRKHLGRTKK